MTQPYSSQQAEEYAVLGTGSMGDCEANVNAWLAEQIGKHVPAFDIVDAGCGSGRWFATLVAAGAKSYMGVDVSEEMLAGFSAHDDDEISTRLIKGEVCEVLEGMESQADVVLSSFNAICFPDPAPLLSACSTALRSGGHLLLVSNVHVPMGMAPDPTTPEMSTAIALSEFSSLDDGERRGQLFRHVLQLENADEIVLEDYFHTLSDYAKALPVEDWETLSACLFAAQGDALSPGEPQDGQYAFAKLCVIARAR